MTPGNVPVLPSEPGGKGRFGAYYTTLSYTDEWDKPWRVGEHADVVVRFDKGDHRLVFWRGTSYIPCWVTENGIWYNNEFVERQCGCCECKGCVEPMSDKLCKFSHVRIIESNDARAVIHWRYAPVDVHYTHPYLDKDTGWGDWVDEVYTVYPDGVCVRKITLHTSAPDEFIEWHEAIIINQPGTMPDDNIELAAITLGNLAGESKSYRWDRNGDPRTLEGIPADCSIQMVNLKSRQKPFMVVAPDNLLVDLFTHKAGQNFPHWDHWPVSMDKSWTRHTNSAERPSHSSLFNLRNWPLYAKTETSVTRVMLNGLTERAMDDFRSVAASWLQAPKVSGCSAGYEGGEYDLADRAYHFYQKDAGEGSLEFVVQASEASPVESVALVLNGWGDRQAAVTVDGRDLAGTECRSALRHQLEGSDLVAWIDIRSDKPINIKVAELPNDVEE